MSKKNKIKTCYWETMGPSWPDRWESSCGSLFGYHLPLKIDGTRTCPYCGNKITLGFERDLLEKIVEFISKKIDEYKKRKESI